MKLSDFTVLTFDCYGTLIDWETGLLEALAPLVRRVKHPLTKDQVLEAHARHEHAQQGWTPTRRYSDLLATVHKRLAEEWGVQASWDEALAYGQSIGSWPAFPDTVDALAYLKQHYRLVILSNVDNASFAKSNAKLKVDFDAIYTAEDIGSYKPSPRNFEYMLEKLKTLGLDRKDVLHTAQSLFHDHGPAKEIGLASCWIDRRHDRGGGFGATVKPPGEPRYDFRFTSLAELVNAHRGGGRAR
jgi:2-haloacid dehalogenase